MMNFHSTQGLYIERSPSLGLRIKVTNVKNTNNKKREFCAIISNDTSLSDGDAYRLFFKLLDEGSLKTKQGGILCCDKKELYYMDNESAFPAGISLNNQLSKDGKLFFNFKTRKFINGIKEDGSSIYRALGFNEEYFPSNLKSIFDKAKWIKNNLDIIRTRDGFKIVEYLPDMYDKVPDVNVKMGKKYPKDISIKSVVTDTNEVSFTVDVWFAENKKSYTGTCVLKDAPKYLYKHLYAFYVAQLLIVGIEIEGDLIKYNPTINEYVVLSDNEPEDDPIEEKEEPAEIEPVKPVSSEEIICDPEKAKSLIGKRVYCSTSYNMKKYVVGTLVGIKDTSDFPFEVKVKDGVPFSDCNFEGSFIKEAPQLEVKCYDFEDKNVRMSLFGKIFINETGTREEQVSCFEKVNGRWLLNGKFTAYKFMIDYVWSDGTRCGVTIDPVEE